jgi:hypothetical protein
MTFRRAVPGGQLRAAVLPLNCEGEVWFSVYRLAVLVAGGVGVK